MTKPCLRPRHAKTACTAAARRFASCAVAAACGCAALPLHAQDAAAELPSVIAQATAPAASAPTGSQPAGARTLDTVFVTGTRRREPVREVPLTVNTVSEDALRRDGAEKLTDYIETLPGVSTINGGGRGRQSVVIRGITLGTDINPPTSTYFDDVPVGASTQFGTNLSLDLGLLDLNHIEIYRGPQGTLYGANALGGVVKYVFNEADSREFNGKVDLGLSSTSHGGLNTSAAALLNIPLKESVAGLRIAALRQHDAGHIDAVGPLPREGVDSSDNSGFRVSALIEPGSKLLIRLSTTAQELKRDGSTFVDANPDGSPISGEFERRRFVAEPYRQRVVVSSADVEYALAGARFNSVTSYQTNRNEFTADSSNLVPAFGPLIAALTGLTLDTLAIGSDQKTTKITQEFRLTSDKNRFVEWLAGVFWTRESSNIEQQIDTTVNGGATGPVLQAVSAPTTFREAAFFGDVTYYLLPALALTAGVRISRNRQTIEQIAPVALLTPAALAASTNSSDNSDTYLLSAGYDLTPTSNVYLRVATGYNPGGANISLTPVANPAYEPNTLTSSEVGYKADLLDKRLSVEAAVYHLDWRKIQLAQITPTGSLVVNGGKARVNGLELTATARPSAQWTLSGSVSNIDGKLAEDVVGLGAVAGDRLPYTAQTSAALRAAYSFELVGRPAFAGLTARYVGKRNSSFPGNLGNPNYVLPAYSVFGLQAGVELERASLRFFVRNLADRRGQMAAQTTSAPLLLALEDPRTVGISATVPF